MLCSRCRQFGGGHPCRGSRSTLRRANTTISATSPTGKVGLRDRLQLASTCRSRRLFTRFVNFLEWDVSEMSMGKYVSFVSQEIRRSWRCRCFPRASFRQSSIYMSRDGRVKRAEDLRGKRIGVPEWAQTASIYTRGWLVHQSAFRCEIEWVQAGSTRRAATRRSSSSCPTGCDPPAPGRSLTEMLL